jgi:excisionase family DNA binding protein
VGGDYISISDAARRSGLHRNTIQRLLRQGKLTGFKEHHGGHFRWWVSVRSLEEYANPWTGYLMDRPGPKLYLTRRDNDEDEDNDTDSDTKGARR